MILGGTVVVLVFTGFVWAAHNKDILRRMKKQYPTAFVMVVMLASYVLISMFGGVMVFVFGITFPLLCKWTWALYHQEMSIHSSSENALTYFWGALAGLQNYQEFSATADQGWIAH